MGCCVGDIQRVYKNTLLRQFTKGVIDSGPLLKIRMTGPLKKRPSYKVGPQQLEVG